MKPSLLTGFSFGLTSATITTLGLMVGLQSGTNSKLAVLGGVLTIAIADAFSDALGIHISEESKLDSNAKHIWEATASTFLSKFLFALTFSIPFFFLSLTTAVIVSIIWGIVLLGVFSYHIAKANGARPGPVIVEHLGIATAVIIITHFVGKAINTFFG
ncbi:MAG: hypothetical protein A3J93_05045 [Candidatus Magasanikbacteria bacterium RIFOXYC2_FULL_42_28]|uniref:VIT family protein n=1 Tax=Candidatus Magasanikbacteria bacterium RIFOXYC2_FULL_42_28 TaxID=1798704 RepID=A0A1F6NVN3_9BACT|nr:MAG: hypothetical protein A3J93_05045 [Candidatus Magasanikbacteria bacterium RIFOXYC2_FULL_42_28]